MASNFAFRVTDRAGFQPPLPCASRHVLASNAAPRVSTGRSRDGLCACSAVSPAALRETPAVASSAQTGGQHKGKLDVVTLGNMCVDIVTPLSELPPKDPEYRRNLLRDLTAKPPAVSSWELGGNSNFLVAAARLGMRTGAVGHAGTDVFGRFMEDELLAEGVALFQRLVPELPPAAAAAVPLSLLDATLLCFVLVDPASEHSFCSLYDFGPWPLLRGIDALPAASLQVLRNSRAMFLNGFIFDELPLETVTHASQHAIDSGAAVFFDPGPRCFSMLKGSRRDALEQMLDLSEVVLMTEEEARTVTGLQDPEAAARAVLQRPGTRTQWCVVKLGPQGAVLCRKADPGAYRAKAFKVDVMDTVGCGDSFAAAVVLGYTREAKGVDGVAGTLTLASAVGAATAMGRGAGRNVARAQQVLTLLQRAAASGAVHDERAVAEALRILQQSLALRV